MTAGLAFHQVSFSYPGKPVLTGINLTVTPGEMVGLLGPNGSGKTTLLKLGSGVISPLEGTITLGGSDIGSMRRKAIAREVAVVPQQFNIPYAFSAIDVVMLGRFPFSGLFPGDNAADSQAAAEAMSLAAAEHLSDRRFDELSGGERQKVILAMALAQQPKLLLLDEPTLHLDISRQVEILELVRRLNRTRGLTVLAAIHDLNLAALYFDRLIVLKNGRIVANGPPAAVLTEELIGSIFDTQVKVEIDPVTGLPHVRILKMS